MGKPIIARFDGGLLSSDGGVLALREVEHRLGLAERLAACIADPRAAERVRHGLAYIIRFRLLMIAASYEDGNDADSLRHDPMFKLALDRLPEAAALCSQPTISRRENRPGRGADRRDGPARDHSQLHAPRHGDIRNSTGQAAVKGLTPAAFPTSPHRGAKG